MSIENVKKYFRQFNMDDKIREFDVSSATVELAARALDCEPSRIAKTLAFRNGDQAILVLTAGDVKIDNAKYRAQFNCKARMLAPAEILEKVGHAVGGVCPFGISSDVAVYLDHSLKRFKTVFPACGSSNSAIELSISEIEQYTNYREWVDVCKG